MGCFVNKSRWAYLAPPRAEAETWAWAGVAQKPRGQRMLFGSPGLGSSALTAPSSGHRCSVSFLGEPPEPPTRVLMGGPAAQGTAVHGGSPPSASLTSVGWTSSPRGAAFCLPATLRTPLDILCEERRGRCLRPAASAEQVSPWLTGRWWTGYLPLGLRPHASTPS